MPLSLYNTLTRTKGPFEPLDPASVRMYVCGPTVYDLAHIGNARPVIVFDTLFRLLRHVYGPEHVTYARNITDVDDKINARAARDYQDMPLNDAIRLLTEGTTTQFQSDMRALGNLDPSVEPRATDNLDQMRDMIEVLVKRGHAYVAEDHVLFDVTSTTEYGRLCKRSVDDMVAGARVEVAPYKRNPMDFVLWKPSTGDMPGWPSPCAIETPGRPGWHIECSAMSKRYLGEVFDIHGGGIDLAFPHHENELAQSTCAHGTDHMAQVWMHNGFLQVEGEKMSKSLGNFVTVHDLLTEWKGKTWPGEVIRLAMLMTQYRQPIDFSQRLLEEAWTILEGWYETIGEAEAGSEIDPAVLDALRDDLNTPKAISRLHQLRSDAKKGSVEAIRIFKASANVMGLLERSRSAWIEATSVEASMDEVQIEALISARHEARSAKNYAEADRIRDQLAEAGVLLKDNRNKETGEITTTWDMKRGS